jgi:hypothetical protein
VHAGQGLDQGRLAGAVVAEQAVHLARVDGEADAGQCDHRAEMLGDVVDLDQGAPAAGRAAGRSSLTLALAI